MTKEEVIAKVEKLMRMANDGDDGETEQAMLLAQKLMAQNHLEQSDLHVDNEPEPVIHTQTDIGYRCNGWKRVLSSVIAENFRSAAIITKSGRGCLNGQIISFVGEKSDAELALKVYEFALKTGELRWTEYSRGCPTERGERETFLTGFVRGINSKFDHQKRANQQWGLVLARPASVDFELRKMRLGKSHERNFRNFGGSAATAGFIAGKNFNENARILPENA